MERNIAALKQTNSTSTNGIGVGISLNVESKKTSEDSVNAGRIDAILTTATSSRPVITILWLQLDSLEAIMPE